SRQFNSGGIHLPDTLSAMLTRVFMMKLKRRDGGGVHVIIKEG
ncbi:hypothetical protein A2U01_0083743, partial [Trifolium medium]|nr:hypothetical protein [Trifolium medium]